jgi:hypothetical protein
MTGFLILHGAVTLVCFIIAIIGIREDIKRR